MKDFVFIKNITEVHNMMDMVKPNHPLVSIIRHNPEMHKHTINVKLTGDVYMISLKDGMKGTFQYGRSSYDFHEGVMTFIAPGQVIAEIESETINTEDRGWSILFHPDLIRRSELGKEIKNYNFFDYEVNEALHLSDKEKKILTGLVNKIDEEINQNIDKHTNKLIINNIQLVLDYCTRYYDRQFLTRANMNRDTVSKFEKILDRYFDNELQLEFGLPTVKYCSEQLNMSANYLGDLLRKETGRNAQDHIHGYIIDKAKNILLNSNEAISQVAYSLGFDYSQHFSKVFKAKTGMSPKEYRTVS